MVKKFVHLRKHLLKKAKTMLNRRVLLVAALLTLVGLNGGIRAFAEGGCVSLATTDNGKFTVELLDVSYESDLVTFKYKVCNTSTLGGGSNPSLSHWVLGLDIKCFGLDDLYTLDDLVVGATFDGVELDEGTVKVGTDPTSGVTGVKFDNGHADRACHTYTVTFDTSVLSTGYTLCAGPVQVATKAGQQIGKATVCGPVCCKKEGVCQTETAFGGVTAGGGKAWWFYYDLSVGGKQTIWAGRSIDVGTVEVVDGWVIITLTDGWKLQNVAESVKIQGYDYDTLPTKRPAAGLFTTYKGDGLVVRVDDFDYYVIHLDVQNCK